MPLWLQARPVRLGRPLATTPPTASCGPKLGSRLATLPLAQCSAGAGQATQAGQCDLRKTPAVSRLKRGDATLNSATQKLTAGPCNNHAGGQASDPAVVYSGPAYSIRTPLSSLPPCPPDSLVSSPLASTGQPLSPGDPTETLPLGVKTRDAKTTACPEAYGDRSTLRCYTTRELATHSASPHTLLQDF